MIFCQFYIKDQNFSYIIMNTYSNKQTYKNIMAKNIQNNDEVLGTVSILSQTKKHNKQDMLIKKLWQYSFKPANQQEMDPLKFEKLRKHHSSQDTHYQHQLQQHFQESELKYNHIQNQYHSLVHEKSSSNNNKYNNQYGLVKRNYNGKQKNQGDGVKDKDNGLTQQDINQYQRVMGIDNNQAHYQRNGIGYHQPQHFNKAGFNTFNANQIKNPPKITKNNNGKNYNIIPNPGQNYASQVQTYLFSPTNDTHPNCQQTYRDQDILHHRKISNYNYIGTQIKEMMQLTKTYIVLTDIEQYRKNIMKLQIQCRRLKISLRSGSSASSKLGNQKKSQTNHHMTAMQEYGYAKQPNKQSSQDRLKIPKINSYKNLLKRSGSNLMNIESNLKQFKQQETYLQSNITKLKQRLENLKNKQEQIDNKLQMALSRNYKSPTKIFNTTKYLQTKSIEEIQNQQTIVKKSEQKQYQNNSFNSLKNKCKENQYRTLLIEKRNVIKESICEFSEHVRYKIQKLNEENNIMKEQLKIVEKRIFDLGRVRNKNSISSHSNSNNKFVRHISLPRKLLTIIHSKKQQNSTNNQQQNKEIYKIKRNIVARSPNNLQDTLANINKNYHHKLSSKKNLMKRVFSQEALIPSIQKIHLEGEEFINGEGNRNQYLLNVQSYNYIEENQLQLDA